MNGLPVRLVGKDREEAALRGETLEIPKPIKLRSRVKRQPTQFEIENNLQIGDTIE